MKKTMKTVSIMLVIIFLFTLTACFLSSTEGIPHGTYFVADDNGNIIYLTNENGTSYAVGAEYAWEIGYFSSTFIYVEDYKIVKENEELYFVSKRSEGNYAHKFKIEYDKQTKILTVYLPKYMANMYTYATGKTYEEETIPLYFKQK